MRDLFYKIGLWIRDSRRTGYLRPILVTAAATAAAILLFKIAEHRLFPDLTVWQSRISGMAFSSVLAGIMAYVALRLYRQLAQETIDELTERLRLSEELLGERNLIKSLMETAVDRIYFKDLDGRYIRASASVASAFGLPAAAEVMGRSDQDFFAENYARQIRQDEQEVIRSGAPIINRSYREVHVDGRETWASITMVPLRDRHGHAIGTLGVARDITEARLREQRFQQMSRALEQSPNLVLITDRNGVIEYINPTFTAVTGYTEEEVRGQNPRLLNSGCNRPEMYRELWATIGAGREWRGELLNRKKNGDLYWARLVISPIREEGGSLTHFVAVTEDITQARQAADALEQEASRRRELERIITISPAVAFLWRAAPGWPVEYVSDNVRRWGYSPEDLTSGATRFPSIIHAEDLARVGAEVDAYTREGRTEFVQEYRLLDRSGGVHWVEDRTWLRRDASGKLTHYQGVVFDITERRRAEMALLESERNLAEAQRIARLGNWVLEWPRRRMQWSEETFRISGLEPAREAPDFAAYAQTLLPEDRPVLELALQESVRLGKPFNLEVRHAVPGGLKYIAVKGQPVLRDGQVVRLFGTLLDITERKRAELAQQSLTEGLRTVLQLADELIACPSEDALYLRAVELARQRLGLERCGIMIRKDAEMVGTYGTDLNGQTTTEHALRIPLNDIWRERLRLRETQEQRWTLVEEPYEILKDGRFQSGPVGWIGITPIQSSMQGAIGVFCNDTAISRAPMDPIKQEVLAVYCSLLGNMVARKRVEEEHAKSLQHQREFMERTDRLNSLGLLAAGMAHEINNPLQGMLSHLNAVQRSLPETFAARASLVMVERGIDTIAMLVRKLLSLGTTDQGAEMANAGEALDFVTQLLDAQFRRARIRMVRDADSQPAVLAMPRRELIQVLLNLMINARDAMSAGGTLTLGCRNDGEYGFLTVADTGAGIAPEILDRIFTPFFTTKGTKGTGLGLSVAESLVRSSGGLIEAKSKLGAGTTFTVQIPLARKERV